MSLTLPADIEPHLIDGYDWNDPGVYCLSLTVPSDVRERWECEFEQTPDYVDMVEQKHCTAYVGATKNVMARLEDHRDGDVRKVALLRVCEIDGVHNIHWFDSKDDAFKHEWGIANLMSQQRPEFYVHQR